MRILLIEDHPRIASFVKRGLEAEGMSVETVGDGERGLERAISAPPDLVILDLGLPTMSGEDVLDRMRADGMDSPVIVLTAKDAISDRVSNLEAGADDYLTKPFSFQELLARVRARLRTTEPRASDVDLESGGVKLAPGARTVTVNGHASELTAREATILEVLMRSAGEPLSARDIVDRVWGYDYEPAQGVAAAYVGHLRRKLGGEAIEALGDDRYRFRGVSRR